MGFTDLWLYMNIFAIIIISIIIRIGLLKTRQC